MKLNFAICLVLSLSCGGSNPWEKPTVTGAKMDYLPVTILPLGKPRAVDNMLS